MASDRYSTGQHVVAVLAVVGLSLVLQAGLNMGRMLSESSLVIANTERGMSPYIAGPASDDWGQTVFKVNGML